MRRLFVNLLDLIFPKRCVGCGRIGNYFCQNCQCAIRLIFHSETICPVCERPAVAGFTHPMCRTGYTIDGFTSFFHYDGTIKKAVKALKYRLVSDVAAEFVSLIPETSFLNSFHHKLLHPIFLPIPLHKMRMHQRGFNQAEILGGFISHRLQIPMYTDILLRTRETKPQVEMKNKEDRLKNMHGVFGLNPKTQHVLRNKHVILFDDVFTTGATMRSAASVLKHAGANRVWAVTMAR